MAFRSKMLALGAPRGPREAAQTTAWPSPQLPDLAWALGGGGQACRVAGSPFSGQLRTLLEPSPQLPLTLGGTPETQHLHSQAAWLSPGPHSPDLCDLLATDSCWGVGAMVWL